MANMIGEVNLLAVAFPDLTIGLQVTAVKYKNGSVIIKLSDQFDDQLLLPESVLSEVSPRFAARFRCTGLAGGRDVTDPSTGEKITVFEYHLAYCDKTFVLTDEVSHSGCARLDFDLHERRETLRSHYRSQPLIADWEA